MKNCYRCGGNAEDGISANPHSDVRLCEVCHAEYQERSRMLDEEFGVRIKEILK